MFDTHAHLNFHPLIDNVEEIVRQCKDAPAGRLSGIIIASSNLDESKIAIDLAKKYPGFLYASVGIHPQDTRPGGELSIEEQLEGLESLIKEEYKNYNNYKFYKPAIKAIGETGLDFSPAPPGEKDRSKEEQMALFKGQIELARKYNLPLIVHSREAHDTVLETLKIYADSGQIFADPCKSASNQRKSHPRGVFHCYAGGKKRLKKILDLDSPHPPPSSPDSIYTSHPHPSWYFGFDGNLTYDPGLQEIIKMIPEDRILIETDSPCLSPVPHRGEVNTPANLIFIQQKINEIFGKDLTEQIKENSKRLFKLPHRH